MLPPERVPVLELTKVGKAPAVNVPLKAKFGAVTVQVPPVPGVHPVVPDRLSIADVTVPVSEELDPA